jgi:ATP-binding cassette, subfamily B, bacterial MsbA
MGAQDMAKEYQVNTSLLLSRVWRDYLKGRVVLLVLAAILMALDGGSLGLLAYYVEPMIDEVFIAQDADAITPIALVLFGIFALRALASFGQRTLTAAIGLRVVADMQKDLSSHLMNLDGRFFSHNSPGNLLERVRGDTQTIQTTASNALIVIGRDAVSLAALIAVAVSIDWKWTLVAFIGLPLLALPVNFLHKLVQRATLKSRLAAATLSTRLDEIFHGIKAIKANRMEDHEADLAEKGIEDFRHRTFQAERGKAALPSVVDLIAGLGLVTVMIYGGQEIVSGEKTLGDFMAFFTSLALLFDPIRRLAGVGGQLQAAAVSLDRIYELLDEKPKILDNADAAPITQPNGEIKFQDIYFSYNENQPVLRGLSLEAEAGKMTAIVGPSGAGKSTLFNLLSRFEEPSSGALIIGDQPLDKILISELRDSIALVTQETALFDESIYQNISCGREDVSEQQVIEAANTALVTDFLAELPDGIQSSAGPRGSNLSGGQRQRVVIARALLRNTPILLLDEATSALDSKTEARIQQAMDKILEGKTSIVIAHRLSTVRKADKICVMDEGRVVEQGNHEELISANGAYARMAASLKD